MSSEAEDPENPYSFLSFLSNGPDEPSGLKSDIHDSQPSGAVIKRIAFSTNSASSLTSNSSKSGTTNKSNASKPGTPNSKPGTPNKSVYHMSMRELRDTLEALQTRNADLEDKDFETEQLKLKVDQLQHKLEVTDDDLLKCRKKCKRLHLELSESRYKEEQDTEDLDRMVKKVEKKLERSEARAAEAEAELHRMRSQHTTVDTDRIAWEISQRADTAELLVKQMTTGIEDLRLIASNLAGKSSGT